MARKLLRRGAIGALAIFAAIQLIQPERSNPVVESDVDAPAEVREILRGACYDCHSHETRWPWYAYVAPVSWLVADHVEHGRGDLNFSRWPKFDFDEQDDILEDIRKQIEKDRMPLRSYRILHPEARLSEEDRRRLLRWAGAS